MKHTARWNTQGDETHRAMKHTAWWNTQHDSLRLTWSHLDSFGFTWVHLDSLDLTWTHLISLGSLWPHLPQGKGNTWSPKGQGQKSLQCEKGKGRRDEDYFWDPFWPYIQLRAHTRTKRNDLPVGLSPLAIPNCLLICRSMFYQDAASADRLTGIWDLSSTRGLTHLRIFGNALIAQ